MEFFFPFSIWLLSALIIFRTKPVVMGTRQLLGKVRRKFSILSTSDIHHSPQAGGLTTSTEHDTPKVTEHLPGGLTALPPGKVCSLLCCPDLQIVGTCVSDHPYFENILGYLRDMTGSLDIHLHQRRVSRSIFDRDSTLIAPETHFEDFTPVVLYAFQLTKKHHGDDKRHQSQTTRAEEQWWFKVSECKDGKFFEQIVGTPTVKDTFDVTKQDPGAPYGGVHRMNINCTEHKDWSYEILIRVLQGRELLEEGALR